MAACKETIEWDTTWPETRGGLVNRPHHIVP